MFSVKSAMSTGMVFGRLTDTVLKKAQARTAQVTHV